LAKCFSPGDVVIADRYYAGYFMIALFTLLGVDVVVRQHQCRSTDFRRGHRLGTRDHVVSWVRPQRPAWMDNATYEAIPAALILREVRVGGWTLVSTFTDAKGVHKRELLDLYRLRWQVELDLRSIKTVMQMDLLWCKSPEMVCKEIAVHLLALQPGAGRDGPGRLSLARAATRIELQGGAPVAARFRAEPASLPTRAACAPPRRSLSRNRGTAATGPT
jgi:Transposase DDE domain